MLLALLLAGLVDAGAQARSRGRLHELRRRLGAGPAPTSKPDLRSVILETMFVFWREYSMPDESCMEIARYFAYDIQGMDVEDVFVLDAIPGLDRDKQVHAGDCFHCKRKGVPIGEAFVTLPRPGLRTGAEPRIAWVLHEYRRSGFAEEFTDSVQENLSSIVDWMEATHPSLSAMTWPEAIAASSAWHARFRAQVGYREPVPEAGVVVLRFPDGARIDRLLDKRDFAAEGTSMGHCVGGEHDAEGVADGDSRYWRRTRDGRNAVFSYRDSAGVPQATIEVNTTAQAGWTLEDWMPSRFQIDERRTFPLDVEQIHGPDDREIADVFVQDRVRAFLWALNPQWIKDIGAESALGVTLALPYRIPEDSVEGWRRDEPEIHGSGEAYALDQFVNRFSMLFWGFVVQYWTENVWHVIGKERWFLVARFDRDGVRRWVVRKDPLHPLEEGPPRPTAIDALLAARVFVTEEGFAKECAQELRGAVWFPRAPRDVVSGKASTLASLAVLPRAFLLKILPSPTP